MKVVTTSGAVHTATKQDPSGGDERVPLTQQEATAVAKRCNQEAENLGLTVRYEAKED